MISHGHEALLRARRRKTKGWDKPTQRAYHRHRWRVEGIHGEGKNWHGLRRAHRRRLWNVEIQAYLTAAVMNLKRLVAINNLSPQAKTTLQRSVDALLSILHSLRGTEAFREAKFSSENSILAFARPTPFLLRLAA